jgi:hypothetical protein
MSSVTTESGQARSDLIRMFEEAQALASAERERARTCRAAITRAVSDSRVREQGDQVHIDMPRQAWDDLRRSAE